MIDKENTFNCNYLQVIVEKSWEKNLSQDIKQNTDTASVFNAGYQIDKLTIKIYNFQQS